jgi:phage gpG-like protein
MRFKTFSLLLLIIGFTLNIYAQNSNWEEVGNVFGKKLMETDHYYKLTFPRTDVSIKIDKQQIDPGPAFTSWAAFLPVNDKSIIMGDLVLLESEVAPILKSIEKNNFTVTAIHNHLINEEPKVMYLHYYASGKALDLAKELKDILGHSATPISNNKTSVVSQNVDWSSVQNILGKGKAGDGLLKYSFIRKENIKHDDMIMPKTYGINTAIGFQKSDDKAFTTGDFVLLSDEVNKVIKVLTQNNITVTALHNHMLNEEPRLFYMHFWGYGKPAHLANAIKEALKMTNTTLK